MFASQCFRNFRFFGFRKLLHSNNPANIIAHIAIISAGWPRKFPKNKSTTSVWCVLVRQYARRVAAQEWNKGRSICCLCATARYAFAYFRITINFERERGARPESFAFPQQTKWFYVCMHSFSVAAFPNHVNIITINYMASNGQTHCVNVCAPVLCVCVCDCGWLGIGIGNSRARILDVCLFHNIKLVYRQPT